MVGLTNYKYWINLPNKDWMTDKQRKNAIKVYKKKLGKHNAKPSTKESKEKSTQEVNS